MNPNASTSSDKSHSENESEPVVASFKCSKTLCIVCAKEVPPAFVIERGKLLRVKEEMELNSFGCDDFILAKQLRAINIVRNVLDISDETCVKLLGQFDGQFNPEFWVKVCVSCKVVVEDYNATRREITRLERKTKQLKEKLKGFISTSNQDEDLVVNSPMWSEIREEVLAGSEQIPPQDELQVDVQMEVEVGSEFRVKTETREERKRYEKRQPTKKAKGGKGKKARVCKSIRPGTTLHPPMTTGVNGKSNAIEPEVESSNDTLAAQISSAATGPIIKGNGNVSCQLEENDANSEDANLSDKDDSVLEDGESTCTPDDCGSLPHSRLCQTDNEHEHGSIPRDLNEVDTVDRCDTVNGLVNPRTINDIPPKVLDLILSTLVEKKDMYNCRSVRHTWNDSMRRVLEQKVLSITTIWNTKEFTATDPLIPKLWMKFSHLHEKEEYNNRTLFVPPSVSRHLGNPFPTNSVKIGTTMLNGSSVYQKGRDIENVVQFFGKFGHHLTCLVTDGFAVSPQRFCELLAKLPNLKTLTLAGLYLKTSDGEAFDRSSCLLPSLTQLTHLRFAKFGTDIGGKLDVPYFLWILEKYGEQLIGLSVEGRLFEFGENFDIFSDQKIKFTNLKQLKISPMNMAVFQLLQTAPLTHIMTTVVSVGHEVKLEELYAHIDRFTETLVYLRIPTNPYTLDGEVGRAIFPCLKKIAIRYPLNEVEVNKVKNSILPKFPVVEHLEFIFSDFNKGKTKKSFTKNIKSFKIWKDCPCLKMISMLEIELPFCNWKQNSKRCIVWSRCKARSK